MEKRWDILGVGCTTVDDLLYVQAYPPADAKVRVDRSQRQCGGLTATALVAAARQGARCAYAGALGRDDLSKFVLEALRRDGIETATVTEHEMAAPIHSTIVVDQTAHTRNIFFQRPELLATPIDLPAEHIRDTRVLFVDHYGGAATVRAQELARAAGVEVVADLERDDVPAFAAILRCCDHLVVSERFAGRLSGQAAPDAAAVALLQPGKRVVVVSCGAKGCWAISAGESEAKHHPAFQVDVVDTTGCGDTFHGVYAAELARGMPLPQRIRRASAAAAIKAKRHGAQEGIPTREAVDEFLKAR